MRAPDVLARREISSNRFLTYVEEDLGLPGQKPYTYYQVESKWDAVLVVPVLADGRLVLERIYRHPYRRFFLEFPAGGIERGEEPVAAAIRELEEETGYRAGRARVIGSHEAMPGVLRMRLHLVLAEDLVQTGRRTHEAMELIETVELSAEACWREAEGETPSSFLTMGLLWYERALRAR
jgi:ADP-ribose pyrophosphatase